MELDPQIKALATAIKKQETGGSKDPYNQKGASGENGAYQFMPDTWKAWAGVHLGNPNAPMTVENQNKVAYSQIKSWKDKGLNPAQIAAAWNAGEGSLKGDKWKTMVGTNSQGVKYDTPSYVKNVSKYYQELKGTTPQTQPQNVSQDGFDLSGLPTQIGPDKSSIVAPLVRGIAGSIYDPAVEMGTEFANRVAGPAANALGYDYAPVKSLPSFANITGDKTAPRITAPGYDENGDPTTLGTEAEKTLGSAGMTALNVATLGKGTAIKEGLQGVGKYAIGKTGGPISSILKAGAREIPVGAGYGATNAMSQGGDVTDIAGQSAAGGALSFAGGALLKGVTNQIAKRQGITTQMLDDLDAAVQSGDENAVRAITSSNAYKKLISANNFDQKAVDAGVVKVRDAIDEGINKSTGVSKLTRSEKAETLTDDGIKAMVEHMQNTDNPIADTKLALENKANDLMDTALNPIIDKIRNEKLPLVPLDRQSLIDDFNAKLDKSYITDLDKQKIKDYVDTLINTQNKGNPFGIVDAGIIRRDANFDFTNPKNKGAVGRMLGNTMREALDLAEKKATDSQTKAIIAHINAVNKEYSRLMQGVDVIDLIARFPGQKASELLNKAAGFFGAGATGNNPLAYLGAHKLTDTAQKTLLRAKNNALFGDMSGKAGPITSSELIGNAKRILNNVNNLSETAQIQKEKAVNTLMETVSPKRNKDLPNIAYGAAPFGVAGVIDKVKNLGKETYQREPEPAKPDNTPELVSQIANAETRGEKDPYSFSQWSNKKLGPASPLGKALGKYQVTEARLKEKAKDFLGKAVSAKEFLASPELQDKFITEQVKWQKKNGLTDEEVLATHRRGWGNMTPEQLKKAVATSTDYIESARTGK